MVNMLKVLIAVLILVMIIAIAILGKKTRTLLRFQTTQTERNESTWILWMITLLTISVAIFDYIQNATTPGILHISGLFVFLAGGIIQIYAKKHLSEHTHGEALKKNFRKATKGIYTTLRHPSKTGLLLLVVGIAMSVGSIWGILLSLLLFLPALLFRISQEERTLLDVHSERYYDYQEHTNKLIPHLL